MDPTNKPDGKPNLDEAHADALLEEKQKKSASGLSWDEVAKKEQKGWREVTEMGEGD